MQDKLQDKLPDKLPDKLLFALKENGKVTIDWLSNALGVSEKTIRIYLKQLVEKGKIVRVGARKNGYWKVIA